MQANKVFQFLCHEEPFANAQARDKFGYHTLLAIGGSGAIVVYELDLVHGIGSSQAMRPFFRLVTVTAAQNVRGIMQRSHRSEDSFGHIFHLNFR